MSRPARSRHSSASVRFSGKRGGTKKIEFHDFLQRTPAGPPLLEFTEDTGLPLLENRQGDAKIPNALHPTNTRRKTPTPRGTNTAHPPLIRNTHGELWRACAPGRGHTCPLKASCFCRSFREQAPLRQKKTFQGQKKKDRHCPLDNPPPTFTLSVGATGPVGRHSPFFISRALLPLENRPRQNDYARTIARPAAFAQRVRNFRSAIRSAVSRAERETNTHTHRERKEREGGGGCPSHRRSDRARRPSRAPTAVSSRGGGFLCVIAFW